jgi:hypothetical protein
MNEEHQELEELAEIAGILSVYSRSLVIAAARGALFGEQTVRTQYGLIAGSGTAGATPSAGRVSQ